MASSGQMISISNLTSNLCRLTYRFSPGEPPDGRTRMMTRGRFRDQENVSGQIRLF